MKNKHDIIYITNDPSKPSRWDAVWYPIHRFRTIAGFERCGVYLHAWRSRVSAVQHHHQPLSISVATHCPVAEQRLPTTVITVVPPAVSPMHACKVDTYRFSGCSHFGLCFRCIFMTIKEILRNSMSNSPTIILSHFQFYFCSQAFCLFLHL